MIPVSMRDWWTLPMALTKQAFLKDRFLSTAISQFSLQAEVMISSRPE